MNYSSPNFLTCIALGQTEDVIMLLNFGVDPTVPDAQSRYVIDMLKKNKNFDAVKEVSKQIEQNTSSGKQTGTTCSVRFPCFKIITFRYKIILFQIPNCGCVLL